MKMLDVVLILNLFLRDKLLLVEYSLPDQGRGLFHHLQLYLLLLAQEVMRLHCSLVHLLRLDLGCINLISSNELTLDELVAPIVVIWLKGWTILKDENLLFYVLLKLYLDVLQ